MRVCVTMCKCASVNCVHDVMKVCLLVYMCGNMKTSDAVFNLLQQTLIPTKLCTFIVFRDVYNTTHIGESLLFGDVLRITFLRI